MVVKVDDLSGPEIAELLAEHIRSMYELTPAESVHALNIDQLKQPEVTFWSAWLDGKLAGCGALKQIEPGHGEIKSMRTARPFLRRGVAAKILQTIVAEAKQRGYRQLSLETGSSSHFEPAHQLYRKFGFTLRGPFTGYVEDPNSFFMTLKL